jgi:wyosine [tRNA(Phe)-imidazoG37] synthetase (radical SAM superfamily)
MLWKDIFYGPVLSRRLGFSLGVNLLPKKRKICNFNCIYCECGLNDNTALKEPLPTVNEFESGIIHTLSDLKSKNQKLDHITFSGNGEPTLHPEFEKIIDLTIKYRNKFYPDCKIAVLTNSTNIYQDRVFNSLQKVDVAICKLDAGSEKLYQLIDAPETNASLDEITDRLRRFNGNITIQTIFLKGSINGESVDNTGTEELNKYIQRLKIINPKLVMIYSLDRTAPYPTIEALSKSELQKIAGDIRANGFKVDYYT